MQNDTTDTSETPWDLSLGVTAEFDTDDDPERVRRLLEAVREGLGLDPGDVTIESPNLYGCIDCGAVVTTDSTRRLLGGTGLEYSEHPDDIDESNLVPLSEPCNVCHANAWAPLEFGLGVDRR